MARRRKTHHRRTRRHRVGAVNMKSLGTKVLGTAAGAFLARTLYNMGVKQFPTMKPAYLGLGLVGIGAFIPKFVRSEIGQSVGEGVIAIGSLSALQGFGLLSGVGAIPGRRVPSRVMSGGPYGNRVMSGQSMPYNRTTVGGANRPFMRTTVGSTFDGPEALGALYMED
jgi:hypothetical protein